MNNVEIAQLGLIKQADMAEILAGLKEFAGSDAGQRTIGGLGGAALGGGVGGLAGGGKGALLGALLGGGGGAFAGPDILKYIMSLRTDAAGNADEAASEPLLDAGEGEDPRFAGRVAGQDPRHNPTNADLAASSVAMPSNVEARGDVAGEADYADAAYGAAPKAKKEPKLTTVDLSPRPK